MFLKLTTGLRDVVGIETLDEVPFTENLGLDRDFWWANEPRPDLDERIC